MASFLGRSARLARPEAAEPVPDAGALGPGALGPGALGMGALVSALLASACCLLPMTLASLGLAGASLAVLAPLAPWQPLFLATSLVCLAAGFWFARRHPAACASTGACARPGAGRAARGVLWAAFALVVLVAAFEPLLLPWLVG